MYKYKEQKKVVFTDEGQRMFLAIRNNVKRLINLAGAVDMESAMGDISGDSWERMACVDRLVELGEIREILPRDTYVAAQYRVFITA